MASALCTKGKYFSIESDINFGNDFLYPMGTNTNRFNGNINGNRHTLSNINIKGYNYTSVFGYNSGTIQNFRFNNIRVNGDSEYTGVIAGYNSGNINGIVVRGATISGNNYTGGITGNNTYRIKNVDVQATITSTGNTVGGIVGETWYNLSQERNLDMVFSGSVKGVNQVGGIAGRCGSSNLKGVVYDTTVQITQENGNIGRGVGNYQQYGNYSVVKTNNITLAYTGDRTGFDGIDVNPITAV